MHATQLTEIKTQVHTLCVEVAAFIREQINKVQSSDIETKDMNSLVSYVDKTAEIKIVKRLSQLIPEAGYITEEDTIVSETKDHMWIIDPLDGTTNFLYKIPHFSISIALSYKGDMVYGIVYDIMLDVAYTAIKGQGAYENNNRIQVRNSTDLQETIVATGFPYKRQEGVTEKMNMVRFCVENCRGIRRLGSAALDLAYVASGKLDAYYENSLNIWDLAAGKLIVEEAGGIVTDYQGEEHALNNGSILAANPDIHRQFLGAIKTYLSK